MNSLAQFDGQPSKKNILLALQITIPAPPRPALMKCSKQQGAGTLKLKQELKHCKNCECCLAHSHTVPIFILPGSFLLLHRPALPHHMRLFSCPAPPAL